MTRTTTPHRFQISHEHHGPVAVVRVRGEVDAATAPRMEAAVEAELERGRRVVLDLHEVEFMDLHGLAVMMRAARRSRAGAGSFAIQRPAPCVRRLVQLAHGEDQLSILPGGDEPPDAA